MVCVFKTNLLTILSWNSLSVGKWDDWDNYNFFFYKNVKAEINQDFKNILPEHSSGWESVKNVFIPLLCRLDDKHKIRVTKKCKLTQLLTGTLCITLTMVFLLHDTHLGL